MLEIVTFQRMKIRWFFSKGNSCIFLSLGKDGGDKVVTVRSYEHPYSGSGNWIIYQPLDNSSELILVNLITGKEQKFNNITGYAFDHRGKILLLKEGLDKDKPSPMAIKYINFKSGKISQIWSTQSNVQVNDINFSDSADQLAFMVKEIENNNETYSIWNYRVGTDQAELKLRDGDNRIGQDLKVRGPINFSKNGRWIFLPC